MFDNELLKLTIIGESPSVEALRQLILKVSEYEAPVLIKGETGTGKELVARGVHYCSDRGDSPFVPINCGAFNDELFLSELYGHEKGAFTDAKKAKAGLLEQAEGGTLFLDEIDSLSLKAQVSLLRFLQEKEYRAVGSETVRSANVRIVSASNKNLTALISEGKFREDLFYRLDVLGIDVPPLKERESDLNLLAEHFLLQYSRVYRLPEKQLHIDTLRWMYRYAWPGNVRELENYLHRIFILSDAKTIRVNGIKADPSPELENDTAEYDEDISSLGRFSDEKMRAIEVFERMYLHEMLKKCDGNVTLAAKKAGKERRSFGRLVKKYGIDREEYQALAN